MFDSAIEPLIKAEGITMKKPRLFGGHTKLAVLAITSVAFTALAGGTMLSMALFTDTETDDSTFTTGTIVLDATKIAALDLTSAALMPGDSVTSSVTVENDGTAQLRYAVSQSSTNGDTQALFDALLLVVREDDVDGGCDDADGTVLRASAAIGESGNLVGNPAQGSHTGDRTLAAGASEVLCFYVSLGINAPNSSQGATTTTTFTFAAEQTANN